MKTLVIALVTTLLAMPAFAGQLPVQINRNADGSVDTVVLVKQKSLDDQDAEMFMEGIASGVDELAAYKGDDLDGAKKLKKDEQAALQAARDVLSSKSSYSAADRQKLNEEFKKAVKQLNSQPLFTLLASPSHPGAFDGETVLVEVIKQIMNQGSQVLGVSPIYSVFDFLVSEYLNSLVARREFFQNALLAQLDTADTEYSAADIAGIRSSVFYSRLDLWNLPKREKAVKAWATFGNTEYAKYTKKCKDSNATYAHSCFKLEGQKVRNLAVSKHVLTSKSSLAVDLTHPKSVGNTRWMIIALKLGVKLAPVPSLAKKPVKLFLDSLYEKQRVVEGFLYGTLLQQNADDLAAAVSGNNANPTF